jgi:mannitol 2-dehydrogenase
MDQTASPSLCYEGLSLEVALWCRYCAGTDEAGNVISPNDDNAADLKIRALAARTDPQAFLSNTLVFGALGQDQKFAFAFAAALASLWSNGVEKTLNAYAPEI